MTATEILHAHGIVPPPPGKQYTRCPQCSAKRTTPTNRGAPCLRVTVKDDGVLWYCNHCHWTGGEKFVNGKANGQHRTKQYSAIYNYADENGVAAARKVRLISGKTKCLWEHYDGGKWVDGKGDAPRLLYRLPELREALANEHAILIVEGEKDVDSAYSIGLPATCNPDGATGKKWRPADSEVLSGADIIVIPDHDDEGYAHAELIAQTTRGIAKRVRMLPLAKHWPQCPQHGDLSDWLAAGHTREELDALISSAPHYNGAASKQHEASDDEIFDAVELEQMQFDPIKSIVPGIFVEGLTLFCGKPKVGKSWSSGVHQLPVVFL